MTDSLLCKNTPDLIEPSLEETSRLISFILIEINLNVKFI